MSWGWDGGQGGKVLGGEQSCGSSGPRGKGWGECLAWTG